MPIINDIDARSANVSANEVDMNTQEYKIVLEYIKFHSHHHIGDVTVCKGRNIPFTSRTVAQTEYVQRQRKFADIHSKRKIQPRKNLSYYQSEEATKIDRKSRITQLQLLGVILTISDIFDCSGEELRSYPCCTSGH